MRKKLIITSALTVALAGAGITTVMAAQQHNTPKHVASAEKKAETKSTPAPATETQVQEAPAASVAPVEQAAPVQATAPSAPEQPVYKWADQMAAAGIAESDYGYVTEMVLNDAGWRLSGPGLWQRAQTTWQSCGGDLVQCLQRADVWVKQYHGTWAQAHELYVRAGNF